MQQHITFVSILHIAMGLLGIFVGVLFFIFFAGIGAAADEPEALFVLGGLGTFIA